MNVINEHGRDDDASECMQEAGSHDLRYAMHVDA